MEPDAGAVTAGIDDAVRADSQLAVGKPDVASPVVPGSEPFGGRFKHVSQGSRPEAGKQLGVLAVDDELESGSHRAPISSAVARALASMPRVKVRVTFTTTLTNPSTTTAAQGVSVTVASPPTLISPSVTAQQYVVSDSTAIVIVVNRFLDEHSWQEAARNPRRALAHLDAIAPLGAASVNRPGCAALVRDLAQYRVRTLAQIARVAQFARELPAEVELSVAPELGVGVPDLRALALVASYVTGGTEILRALEAAAKSIGEE